MLFDRFVFVLYILIHYAWFLLGTIYHIPMRYCSIISLTCSLIAVLVISLFQLQKIIDQKQTIVSDKWSTIAWTCVHLAICCICILDGLEWVNPIVIFGISGVLMSIVIIVVGICACFVIMQDGTDWHAHIQLTCVSFWFIIQFMILRLSNIEFRFVTVVPIALMTITRLSEQYVYKTELCAWFVCCLLHVLYDVRILNSEIFLWSCVGIVTLLVSMELKSVFLLTILPVFLTLTTLYIVFRVLCGTNVHTSLSDLRTIYNDYIVPDDSLSMLPFEGDTGEDDWDTKL